MNVSFGKKDSPEMAWNYHDRFQIYLNMGKKREAKNSLKKLLKIRESSFVLLMC